MADFDSSYDSGEEVTEDNSFDSVDISESETEIDINTDEEASVDISGENNIEVTIPSGNEGEVSIDETNDTVNIDESNISKSIEVNAEQEGNGNIELDDDALKEYLEKDGTYSMEVTQYISSPEELQVYKDAGLVERNVDGRVCLIREDLDLDYVDKQSGLTNAELIAKGRAPYDAKTGERIELHHIGQDFNSPLAELKSVSEHDTHSKTLHKSEMDSWRRDPEKVNQYNAQRKAHWKNRV